MLLQKSLNKMGSENFEKRNQRKQIEVVWVTIIATRC